MQRFVNFDLTSGSPSRRQRVQKVKLLEVQLPAGLPADALAPNDSAPHEVFRKLLGR